MFKEFEDQIQQEAMQIQETLNENKLKLVGELALDQNQIENLEELNEDDAKGEEICEGVIMQGKEKENQDHLSDISDSEINQFLLSPEEQAIKSIIWHNINKDWLQEQIRKQEKITQNKITTKRKKKVTHEIINASNPVEAIKTNFKISKNKKFNDNVLKNIFPTFNSETLETKTMEKKIKQQ
eukprot:TRINITY_DN13306_c0_g1_i4.p3 TRINITY_DN13306_c0_g1~~TRINITY_DN13306_c0_g1_i4.p3  ORF type:complete len:183 (-),score=49.99 TRINITY_DN13306_c0_g1_i4:55-603(-)